MLGTGVSPLLSIVVPEKSTSTGVTEGTFILSCTPDPEPVAVADWLTVTVTEPSPFGVSDW
jgi:hypothetical protein